MKRLLFLSLLFVSYIANAETVNVDGISYEIYNEDHTATLKKAWSVTAENFIIPSQIEYANVTYAVTSIGINAFIDNEIIKSVTIPMGIKYISSSAFRRCSNLMSVEIPSSINDIGSGAFRECDKLAAVHISDLSAWCNIDFANAPANPLYNSGHLFLNNEDIVDLCIPDGVQEIKRFAFSNGIGFKSLEIPKSVKRIGEKCFEGCTNLNKINITDLSAWCSIKFYEYSNPLQYAKHLYLNNEEIKDLIIDGNVSNISNYAFQGCEGLTTLTLSEGVLSVGQSAFSRCPNLTKVFIPLSLQEMKAFAFGEFDGLSFMISDLGAWAKMEKSKIDGSTVFGSIATNYDLYLNENIVENLELPEDLFYIANCAFMNCRSIKSLKSQQIRTIGRNAFMNCNSLESVNLGDEIKTISHAAFYGCSSLTSVAVGKSINEVGEQVFSTCPSLSSFICYAEDVPSTHGSAFDNAVSHSTLYVPAVSVYEYKLKSPWSKFGTIKEIDSGGTGINSSLSNSYGVIKSFSIDGKSNSSLQKGVNVVKTSNGKTKKVVIK